MKLTEKIFIATLGLDFNKVPQKYKKELFSIFASRGLTKEYIDMCYGEIDLLTALKLIK